MCGAVPCMSVDLANCAEPNSQAFNNGKPEQDPKPHELLELGAERYAERARGSGSITVSGAGVASTPSVSSAVFLFHTSRCRTIRKGLGESRNQKRGLEVGG